MEPVPTRSKLALGLRPKALAKPHAKSAASRLRQGSHGWLLRQAERLDRARQAALAARTAGAASSSGVETGPLSVQRSEHRTTTGMLAVGFNVGRHVHYVLGRPTLVLQARISNVRVE